MHVVFSYYAAAYVTEQTLKVNQFIKVVSNQINWKDCVRWVSLLRVFELFSEYPYTAGYDLILISWFKLLILIFWNFNIDNNRDNILGGFM